MRWKSVLDKFQNLISCRAVVFRSSLVGSRSEWKSTVDKIDNSRPATQNKQTQTKRVEAIIWVCAFISMEIAFSGSIKSQGRYPLHIYLRLNVRPPCYSIAKWMVLAAIESGTRCSIRKETKLKYDFAWEKRHKEFYEISWATFSLLDMCNCVRACACDGALIRLRYVRRKNGLRSWVLANYASVQYSSASLGTVCYSISSIFPIHWHGLFMCHLIKRHVIEW